MTAVTRAAARRSVSPQSTGLMMDATPQPESRRTSPVKSTSPPSDGEDRIRPTRKKLERTSIGAPDVLGPSEIEAHETRRESSPGKNIDRTSDQGPTIVDPEMEIPPITNGERPRPRRKRSFEESTEEHEEDKVTASTAKHLRKRWRDVGNGETVADGDSVSSQQSSDLADPDEDTIGTVDEPSTSNPGSQLEAPTTPPTASEDIEDQSQDVYEAPRNESSREQLAEGQDTKDVPDIETSPVKPNVEASLTIPTTIFPPKIDKHEQKNRIHTDEGVVASHLVENEKPAPAKIPFSSGFANSSTQSPFAVLSQTKSLSSKPQTSSSAFAGSGFAALSGSSQSPFGALAPTKPDQVVKDPQPAVTFSSAPASGFASLGANAMSSFASAAPSVFGSQSGFGQLGNGYKPGSGFGAMANKPLSSFASSAPSGVIGVKQVKPFGAPVDDEDEAEASGTEDEPEVAIASTDDEHKDKRFYEQEVETGEEDEVTEFNNRAKLYMTVDKQWKERGTGNLKINSRVRAPADHEDGPYKISARFLMRADGSHRIVLNSPITKEIKIEDPTGGAPSGGRAIFLGFVDDKPAMLQVKMRSSVQTQELRDVVVRLQKGM